MFVCVGRHNPLITSVCGDKKHLQSKMVGGMRIISTDKISTLFSSNYSYEPPTAYTLWRLFFINPKGQNMKKIFIVFALICFGINLNADAGYYRTRNFNGTYTSTGRTNNMGMHRAPSGHHTNSWGTVERNNIFR